MNSKTFSSDGSTDVPTQSPVSDESIFTVLPEAVQIVRQIARELLVRERHMTSYQITDLSGEIMDRLLGQTNWRLDAIENPRAFCAAIARTVGHNALISHLRRRRAQKRRSDARVRSEIPDTATLDEILTSLPDPTAFEQFDVDPEDLTTALAKLREERPSRYEMLIMRYSQELSCEEIASLVDRPVNTVKSTLSRTLETLRGDLMRRRGIADHGSWRHASP